MKHIVISEQLIRHALASWARTIRLCLVLLAVGRALR